MCLRFLPLARVTFDFLINVLVNTGNVAAHNVRCGCWNKGVIGAYFRTCDVATLVCNNLWTMCQNNDAINDNNKPEDNDDGKIGDNDAPLTPDPSGVLPEMWESVLLVETYLDCGMHLVFHGVVAYGVE